VRRCRLPHLRRPFVAGVAFEILRLAGRFRHNPVAAALSRPGMWTQLLTTREPDDDQLEVAIASLRAVIDAERGATGGEGSGETGGNAPAAADAVVA